MEKISAFRELRCDVFLADCPARKVLALLAEKWTLLVVHALSERTYRTAELRRRIGATDEPGDRSSRVSRQRSRSPACRCVRHQQHQLEVVTFR